MSGKLKTMDVYCQPIPLRFVHSRMTSKLKPIKTKSRCCKTEQSPPPAPKPQHCYTSKLTKDCTKRLKLHQFSYFHCPDNQKRGHVRKIYLERAETIGSRRKDTSLSERLPYLDSKAINKTAIVAPKRNYQQGIQHCDMEHYRTQSSELPQFSQQSMGFGSKVLALDLTTLPKYCHLLDTISPVKPRTQIDNTLNRLQQLRQHNLKVKDTFQDFDLKPWQQQHHNPEF